MKIREIMESMSQREALRIFNAFGVDADDLDQDALKSAFRELAMKNHPDRGGDLEKMKLLTAAFDALKNKGATRNNFDQDASSGNEGWAQAGHSGGMRNSSKIYRNDYSDMNFFKKRMWELSGHSKEEWTIYQFDGRFFRHTITVYGSPSIFKDMAEAMLIWGSSGNPYETRAIFVQRRRNPTLYLIYADNHFYDRPIPMEHESFNSNPGNDQSFVRSLPHILDELKDKQSDQDFLPEA